MTRIEQRFAALKSAGRKALVTFITAGDPATAHSVPALHALVRGGADVLELGMPFSDPEGEGPSIQASSERALAGGVRLADVFDMVREFRGGDDETPVLLMGYLNAIERIGYPEFADRAQQAGIDGLIIVNLPPEEARPFREMLEARDMNLVFLVAPTTTEARSAEIAAQAGGFVYYVSLKGVTGAAHLQVDSVAERVALLRRHTDLPIVVGFGIKDGDSASRIARDSDGVAVGSALVDTMARLGDRPEEIPAALETQLGKIRAALDGA